MKSLSIARKTSICIITLFMSFLSFSATAQQPLYHDSSLIKLEHFVTEFVQDSAKEKIKPKTQLHYHHMMNIIVTGQLLEHSEYMTSLLQKFKTFSPEVKLVFANALVSIKREDVLKQLGYAIPHPKDLRTIHDINSIDLVTIKRQLTSSVADNTDYLWAAFEATGKDEYLIKILSYLASEPVPLRTLAFEMINREMLGMIQSKNSDPNSTKSKEELADYSDIVQAINDLSKKNPAYSLDGLIAYKVVLASMEARRRVPEIESKIQKALKRNSKLDYRKDIKL